jgi:predicted NUDIX family phosphoesterase
VKVCCVAKSLFPQELANSTCAEPISIFSIIEQKQVSWIERDIAEKDENYFQLIAYILIRRQDEKFFCYQRTGSEKRLYGLYSLGLGGHIETSDKKETLKETLEFSMLRELSEELSNFEPSKTKMSYLGMINENRTEVGRVHVGMVYLCECLGNYIPLCAQETKISSWKTFNEIKLLQKESWSDLALKLL